MRVVSLLPSATDTVVALGLANLLVGCSHECDAAEVASVPRVTESKVGDTTTLPGADIDAMVSSSGAALWEAGFSGDVATVLANDLAVYKTSLTALQRLRPDVILTQVQEPNGALTVAQAEEALGRLFGGHRPRIVQLVAESLSAAWAEVQGIADALGQPDRGRDLVGALERRVQAVAVAVRGRARPRVLCVQWDDPLYAAGGWVPELIAAAGGVDVAAKPGALSPAVAPADVPALSPDVVLFALCGFDVALNAARARGVADAVGAAAWAALPAVRRGAVIAIDGVRLLSRAGPALADAAEALVEALHPAAQPYGFRARGLLRTVGGGAEAGGAAASERRVSDDLAHAR